MRAVTFLLLVLSVAGLSACSGEQQDGGSRPGGGTASIGGPGAAGSGAGTAGGGTAGTGDLGNGGSSGLPPITTMDGGTTECPIGQMCLPENPDEDGCGSLTLEGDVETVVTPGNVLIVFDRSGSMTNDWNGMARWQAAGGAVVGALTPQQDQLNIGAVFFPSDQGILSCAVEPINAATQVAFAPGPMALAKIQTGPMYAPGLGQTPTLAGLQVADAALAQASLTGTTVVILVTDGDPNCKWDQTAAVNLVTAWAAKGIKTYVLGVPGVGSGGELTLNAVASAGGTMQYIPPTDGATLQQKVQEIVQQTVSVGFDSCVINLNDPADAPEKLHLVVKEQGMELDVPRTYPSGEQAWTISADGATIELLGRLCEAATTGVYEQIRFEFGCVDLPPAPPPPIPE